MLSITKYKGHTNQNSYELSHHTGHSGHHQIIYKQQMLERVWRKGNVPTLLMGT